MAKQENEERREYFRKYRKKKELNLRQRISAACVESNLLLVEQGA